MQKYPIWRGSLNWIQTSSLSTHQHFSTKVWCSAIVIVTQHSDKLSSCIQRVVHKDLEHSRASTSMELIQPNTKMLSWFFTIRRISVQWTSWWGPCSRPKQNLTSYQVGNKIQNPMEWSQCLFTVKFLPLTSMNFSSRSSIFRSMILTTMILLTQSSRIWQRQLTILMSKFGSSTQWLSQTRRRWPCWT